MAEKAADIQDQVTDMDQASISFFIFPSQVLKSLRQRLAAALGPEKATGILYSTGMDCGRTIALKIHTYMDAEELLDNLASVWIEVGLGILELESSQDGVVRLRCHDSNEAKALGLTSTKSCDLSRGYLAGLMSAVVGRRYTCTEESCISRGDACCLYELREADRPDADRPDADRPDADRPDAD